MIDDFKSSIQSAVGTTDFVKWGFNPTKKGEGEVIDKLRLFARSADFSLTPGLRSTQGTEIAAAISQGLNVE